jgi:hypothetical protein
MSSISPQTSRLRKTGQGRLASFHSNQVFRLLFSAFRPYGFASLAL